ncbi:MAG: CotH kinase family protein [Bacteroidales bacterium]|nr:CotH kinase family protein [Bacteroidales bacterium]
MNKLKIFFIICIIGFFTNLQSQPVFPDDGVVFNDSIVSRVDIEINPDTLEWIYDNVESYQVFHATFMFTRGDMVDTIENVGFRLRGNTSRHSAKKSFKISFNTFEPGRKWHGLEKLNLNGEHNDPSISRSKISWDLLRQFNIAAPRSNHVEVYINGNYYGLYINVEHIDEEFVESRFGNKNGNLYKCLWPADLDYKGADPDLYKENLYDRRTYDLKTNTALDDYTGLAHFIDVLNNSDDNEFLCEMDKVFNIYDYLKIMVVDVFIGNWDGYIYNKNNFYLYHNTATDKFEYIHYDLDNTLGIDWFDRDWGSRDVYDWQQHGDNVRPLYTRIIENQELKNQYTFYFHQLLEELITSDLTNKINNLRDKIAPYVVSDPYYPLDYGYSYNDFLSSFDNALGGHVDYGIKPYISTRKGTALSQLDNNEMAPVIKYLDHVHPMPGEDLWVSAYVEDEDPAPDVRIYYSINGGVQQNSIMYDDGEHNDGSENDGIYGGVVFNLQMNTNLEYQVKAVDEFGYSNLKPCEPVLIQLYESDDPDLFINEFMASNTTTIADEYGEFDDWIEIYNGGAESVWLGDKHLSDNYSSPDKWQFPDITLEPQDFVLVWADNDTDQGPLHANFKLSAAGEEIGLYDSESAGFFIIDTISFGQQETDISYGLISDGNMPWAFFNAATPGTSNVFESVLETANSQNHLKIYPNPADKGLIYLSRACDFVIYNSKGEKVTSETHVSYFNAFHFQSGIYLLITSHGATVKFIIR